VRFCPTGGIDRAKASSYLALPNVACVGGSWVAPTDAIKARDWNKVEVLAKEAALLQRQS
jgi:2-dehydro-3-deoxyphosphogluconate aldolase/(4S)-4-hydroxy-2-oxoglutarate aldolase